MINRVILVGNLTRDAETSAGVRTTMTRMRLATHSAWVDGDGVRQERTEYHSVVAFGGLAETCGALCNKGRQVYIEGRLRTRDFQASDGVRRTITEIVADHMRLLGRREASGEASADQESMPSEVVPAAALEPALT